MFWFKSGKTVYTLINRTFVIDIFNTHFLENINWIKTSEDFYLTEDIQNLDDYLVLYIHYFLFY